MGCIARKAAPVKLEQVREIISKYEPHAENLVSLLRELNQVFGYLPRMALEEVATTFRVPLSHVYGLATFYSLLSVTPMGRHIIRFCDDAPCHVVGAAEVLAAVKKELGIEVGQTTEDGRFTLEMTSCIGACGVGPVMMIDDEVYGNLTPEMVPQILAKYR